MSSRRGPHVAAAFLLVLAALLGAARTACAQAYQSGVFLDGYVLRAADMNQFKTDLATQMALSLPLTGGVLSGELVTAASTTAAAGINCPQGVAPTSPANGDLWCTSTGVFARINGVSTQLNTSSGVSSFNTRTGAVTLSSSDVTTALAYTPLDKAGSAAATGKITLMTGTTSAAPLNVPQGSAPTSPVNGDVWTTSTGVFARINGSTQTLATTAGAVSSFNTRTGAVTLSSSDVTTALTYTPLSNASGQVGTSNIASSAITNGLLANMAAGATKCNATGSSAAPTDCTASTMAGILKGTSGSTLAAGNDSRFGYLGLNSQSAAYTIADADCGGELRHPASDTTARTVTLPANASDAIAPGCVVQILNECSAGAITLQITSDTMVWSPSGSTTSRTIPPCAWATVAKQTSTSWYVTGTGISVLSPRDAPAWVAGLPANDDLRLDMAA